jgi:hypothetical protein
MLPGVPQTKRGYRQKPYQRDSTLRQAFSHYSEGGSESQKPLGRGAPENLF